MNASVARFTRFLVAGLILLAGPASFAVDLVEGVNYKPLKPAQPTSVAPGKVEVVEVFWYACGHCYLLEPKLEAWDRKGRPANAQLVRLPATWNNALKTHARLFYTMELLGKQSLNPEIWREINVKGNRLDTPAAIDRTRSTPTAAAAATAGPTSAGLVATIRPAHRAGASPTATPGNRARRWARRSGSISTTATWSGDRDPLASRPPRRASPMRPPPRSWRVTMGASVTVGAGPAASPNDRTREGPT
jgi:hypothetical protein